MPHILIADDEESIQTILAQSFAKKGYDTLIARNGKEALNILETRNIDVALLDIRMPELSGLDLIRQQNTFLGHPLLIIMTAQNTMENAIDAMKHGAYDYLTKPFDLEEMHLVVKRALESKKLKEENEKLKSERISEGGAIVGQSKVLQEIFKTIGKIADEEVTVLIEGESGTGKELVARVIHKSGGRSSKPFLAINCSAIPRELLESELFGSKKGAYTGSLADKAGFFEQAYGGTLFLDEIGDMPFSLQAKLLRVLQEKEIVRLGDTHSMPVDVRVIAATNKNLKELVAQKKFREDLFYRLNVVPIHLPPLRERREDIPLLIQFFLQKFSGNTKKISPQTVDYLKEQVWPGNIRELENILKRACVLLAKPVLEKEDIEPFLKGSSVEVSGISFEEDLKKWVAWMIHQKNWNANIYDEILPFLERPLFEVILKKTEGNQLQAANLLGINRNTLRKRLKELGLDV